MLANKPGVTTGLISVMSAFHERFLPTGKKKIQDIRALRGDTPK